MFQSLAATKNTKPMTRTMMPMILRDGNDDENVIVTACLR